VDCSSDINTRKWSEEPLMEELLFKANDVKGASFENWDLDASHNMAWNPTSPDANATSPNGVAKRSPTSSCSSASTHPIEPKGEGWSARPSSVNKAPALNDNWGDKSKNWERSNGHEEPVIADNWSSGSSAGWASNSLDLKQPIVSAEINKVGTPKLTFEGEKKTKAIDDERKPEFECQDVRLSNSQCSIETKVWTKHDPAPLHHSPSVFYPVTFELPPPAEKPPIEKAQPDTSSKLSQGKVTVGCYEWPHEFIVRLSKYSKHFYVRAD
jgi:hypothetical protein